MNDKKEKEIKKLKKMRNQGNIKVKKKTNEGQDQGYAS